MLTSTSNNMLNLDNLGKYFQTRNINNFDAQNILNSGILNNLDSDSYSGNTDFSELDNLLEEKLQEIKTNKNKEDRLPNYDGDLNKRKLEDLMMLAEGNTEGVLSRIERVAQDTFNNANFDDMQNIYGGSTNSPVGGYMSEAYIDSINTKDMKIPLIEKERSYLMDLLSDLTQGPSRIVSTLTSCGMPDDETTAKKAQEIYNNILNKSPMFDKQAQKTANSLKARETDLKSHADLIEGRYKKRQSTMSKIAQSFGGSGGQG